MIIVTEDIRSIIGVQSLESMNPNGVDYYYSRLNIGDVFDGAADVFNVIYTGTTLRGILVPILIGNDRTGRVVISIKNIVNIPNQDLAIDIATVYATPTSMKQMGDLFQKTNLINILTTGYINDEDIETIKNYK